MFTRFNGNVVPFADDSTSTNRTVFGGTTQSDLIDDNLNTNFKKGWEIVGLNDNPTREDFNAMGYTLGALTAYLYEMGISEWNASQNYRVNSRVIGSDGKIYKALTGTTGIPNVGKNPTTDAVNWKIDTQFDINSLVAKTIPIDSDNLAIQETGGLLKKLSWANIKTVLNLLYVGLAGNQTVAGIKTFTSSPIVPAPTTDTQAANKKYVDNTIIDRIGLVEYSYVAKSYHIVAFGGEFNRADYPKLWAYLQANPTLVKTQAQWTTESTANDGICGFFSSGNGTTTFRVPNLDKAFLRPDSRGVGSFQVDMFKSHNHDITMRQSNWNSTISDHPISGYNGSAVIYPTSPAGEEETRPKNIAVLPLIVAK